MTAAASSALVLAWGASFNTTAAIGVTVAVAVAIAVVARPKTLLLILATSIFIEVVQFGGTTISRVLAPIALLTILVQFLRGRTSIRLGSPLVWAGAYSLWALASGLWTTSTSGTLFLLSSLAIALIYMLAFASLLQTRIDLERVLWVLALGSLIVGAFSFRYGAQASQVGGVVEQGRAEGLVGDPNFFAAVQLVMLPLVIVLAAEAKRHWLQFALYATVIVNIASILTSLSRGGLLGLAVLLVLIAVAPYHLLFRSRRNKAIALLVVALGATVLAIQFSSALSSRIGPLLNNSNPAARKGSGRVELWTAARASIEKHPWLGLGYGGFIASSEELLLDTPGVDLSHYSLRTRGQPAHNTYLESFADLGVVGLVLYLALLTSTGRLLRRTARQAREAGEFFASNVAGALLLGLITWSVISLFLSTETSRTFWIIIGLSLAGQAHLSAKRL